MYDVMYDALCDQEEKLRLTAAALQGLPSRHMHQKYLSNQKYPFLQHTNCNIYNLVPKILIMSSVN